MSLFEEKDKFLRRAARQALWLPGPATQAAGLGRPDIESLIPHREPFLLVDAITAVDYEQQALAGVRRIDPADPVFAGHFPGDPVYPGVLQVEMMGQFGLCLMALLRLKYQDKGRPAGPPVFRLVRIYDSVFFAPVWPGDELTVRALTLEDNGLTLIMAGQISRGDTFCASAIVEVYYA